MFGTKAVGYFLLCTRAQGILGSVTPTPPIWPEKFHALLAQNATSTGELAIVDLWYDFPGGRNLNIVQSQGGELEGPLWENERQNGSSYYYNPATEDCNVIQFKVGLVRPDWLSEATYLGEEDIGIYTCEKWQNGEVSDDDPTSFLTFWTEKGTQRPVKWVFYTGRSMEFIRWDPGAELEDSQWQVPTYCFPPASTSTGLMS